MLYIVSTPIGNLKDITLRALDTLKKVDLIASEDTRHTKILLDHYNIKNPLTSFHSYNKIKKTEYLLSLLKQGKDIALVSDAGTPGISDPGVCLIRQAIDSQFSLTVIPGPTALISALVLSGFPAHRFCFEGFLPKKKGQRIKRLKELSKEKRTLILYESPHRLLQLLDDIIEVMGKNRKISAMREITKRFEEVFRGSVGQAIVHFRKNKPRGEFVIVF